MALKDDIAAIDFSALPETPVSMSPDWSDKPQVPGETGQIAVYFHKEDRLVEIPLHGQWLAGPAKFVIPIRDEMTSGDLARLLTAIIERGRSE